MGERVIVVREDAATWRILKYTAAGLVGLAIVGGLGVFLARDQMARHQRDLFSPHPLRRLAALGHLRSRPGVDNVLLLRDYLAWENRPMLRRRAAAILSAMEKQLASSETVEGA